MSATTRNNKPSRYPGNALGQCLQWAHANGVVAPAPILYQWVRADAPKALGRVLTTFCKALALLQSGAINGPTRMMDFALLGEAVTIIIFRKPKGGGSLK